ncbi:MAG: Zn-ribbon domain-containing OB-fold protein [Chloroflexi bacterium]|nr:Zn-ribbon domain-containing OB-fold protein [Chloroflexota bacterium]
MIQRDFVPAVPMPPHTPETWPFWDAAREGRLLVSRCRSCGERHFCRASSCPACQSKDLEWVESSGRGTIHSFVAAHRPASRPNPSSPNPRVIAVIQLEEGLRMMADLIGIESESEVSVDMPVEIVFRAITDDFILFSFRPAASG